MIRQARGVAGPVVGLDYRRHFWPPRPARVGCSPPTITYTDAPDVFLRQGSRVFFRFSGTPPSIVLSATTTCPYISWPLRLRPWPACELPFFPPETEYYSARLWRAFAAPSSSFMLRCMSLAAMILARQIHFSARARSLRASGPSIGLAVQRHFRTKSKRLLLYRGPCFLLPCLVALTKDWLNCSCRKANRFSASIRSSSLTVCIPIRLSARIRDAVRMSARST